MRASPGGGGRGRGVAAGVALAVAGLLAAVSGAAAAPAAAAGPTAAQAALLDIARDVVVESTFVPSAQRPQGEVRIVRRGGRAVVQTILYTRVLKRVIGAISDKERRNWPAGAAGHADMERYVAALEEFRRAAAARPDQAGAEVDRRVQALIEFIDAPGDPLVAIGGVTLAATAGQEGTAGAVRIGARATPALLSLSADYVRRNMALIVADAFSVDPGEAATRLAAAAGP
jgi:hypothetical protein